MKLVIFGDRNFVEYLTDPHTLKRTNTGNYETLKAVVEATDSFKQGKITEVISGKARGADTLGERWAQEHMLPVLPFPAEWDKYGKGAGPIRNRQMAEIADLAIGFLAPTSKGTKNMIETCKKLNVPVLVYHIATGEVEIFPKR